MLVFKKKQVLALLLVLMVIVAGYLQYNNRGSNEIAVGTKDGNNLGEAVYVNGSTNTKNPSPPGISVKQSTEFFTQTRLNKESTRSKSKESLKQITESENVEKSIKDDAHKKLIKIISDEQKEMKIETLIKEKGFSDVTAIIGEDDSIDIVVKASNLSSADIAQIVDIASRQASVKESNVRIKSVS